MKVKRFINRYGFKTPKATTPGDYENPDMRPSIESLCKLHNNLNK